MEQQVRQVGWDLTLTKSETCLPLRLERKFQDRYCFQNTKRKREEKIKKLKYFHCKRVQLNNDIRNSVKEFKTIHGKYV